MARLSMAERVKLSVLLVRRGMRNTAGRLRGHPLIRWNIFPGKTDRLVIAPQDLRTADGTRASEIYAGRFAFAGKVVICDGRSPFEITPPSEEWAAAVLGFGWLRHLRAAESGITRANARALVDEWITLAGIVSSDRLAARHPGAAHHRVAEPGAAGAARRRRAVLPPLPAQPAAPGALPAPHRARGARRRAAHAGAGRADLRGAVHGRAGAAPAQRGEEPGRGDRAANPARWRTHQPQSRRADRGAARSAAAAPGVRGVQHRAAAAAQQRDRPDDADAALLPPRRRQLRAVQRHGADPARSDRHHPRLRRRARRAARQRAALRLPAHRGEGPAGGDGHRPAAAVPS